MKFSSLIILLFLDLSVRAQNVEIGVFTLFHPQQLTLRALQGASIAIEADSKTLLLDSSSGSGSARLSFREDKIVVSICGQEVKATQISATGRNGEAVDFVLAVPEKISRHYRGRLHVGTRNRLLVPVVSMDLETAVASAVQAESPPDAPLEALKAQAVASRSYFVSANKRHDDFDFCDTTHCQFLREPPGKDSPASIATAGTRGMILSYNEQAFAPMFTRSCGGQTRTPREIGLEEGSYPYFSVECKFCREHPARWQAHLSQSEAAQLQSKGEAGRLDLDRLLGWSAVRSNNFTIRKDGSSKDSAVIVEGVGHGHGVGLCQLGAKAMAENGASFQEIIDHYYPNTTLREVSSVRITIRARITNSSGGN